MVAARLDQRCSYCFYCPVDVREQLPLRNLLVYIHGEGRGAQYLLNKFRLLAKECGYLLVCPLFPANILRDGNLAGYKYLSEGEIRYDDILLDIVAEVRGAFDFEESRFLLGGFSGGGQFVHRFFYLHPEVLKSVSIAAPGSVTLLDDKSDWWVGTQSISEFFGKRIDVEALRQVNIQMIVGDADARDDETVFTPDKSYWNLAGRNRVERLKSLYKSFEANDVKATLQIIPGVGHSISGLLPYLTDFLKQ